MTDIVFLHGMEGSPNGTKSQFLKKNFPACRIPELPPGTEQRMKILDEVINRPAWFVGSSLGGLSALLFAMKKPELVRGMVLMAPAVGFYDTSVVGKKELDMIRQTYIPLGIPTTVIAAIHDDVIPLKNIEEMVDRSPGKDEINLIKTDDDHRLNQSLDILLNSLKSLILTEG